MSSGGSSSFSRSGVSLGQIAKRFNAEGVLSPQPPRNRTIRAWCPSSIRSMLKNERYHGVFVWNRTEKRRNPETARKTSRRRPAAEWRRTAVPAWRIVPEPLWDRRPSAFLDVTRIGIARCGGFARSESSRKYLFSGLLRCGCCDSRMVIVSGQGKRGYSKYGCPSNWYRGVCQNRLTIRQDRLEAQLLSRFGARVWKPDLNTRSMHSSRRSAGDWQIRRKRDDPVTSRTSNSFPKKHNGSLLRSQQPGIRQRLLKGSASIESANRGTGRADRHEPRADCREPSFDASEAF